MPSHRGSSASTSQRSSATGLAQLARPALRPAICNPSRHVSPCRRLMRLDSSRQLARARGIDVIDNNNNQHHSLSSYSPTAANASRSTGGRRCGALLGFSCILLALLLGPGQAFSYERIVVFGDSSSGPGNLCLLTSQRLPASRESARRHRASTDFNHTLRTRLNSWVPGHRWMDAFALARDLVANPAAMASRIAALLVCNPPRAAIPIATTSTTTDILPARLTA